MTGRKIHILCYLLTIGLFVRDADPQTLPEDRGTAGLRRALLETNTRARVLYVVAHPDDEDAGTLTLLARGQGARVVLLSLTRGESGANLITGDFFDRLGALRTLEHRTAARHYGVELRYSRFADFGYSKNVDETWRNWPREQVLRDVVFHIRKERPHVVIARFQGTPRDGHGHHQASGMLAREAFEAAADPSRFADLSLPAWSASKLYFDNWRAGDEGVIAVDSGIYDPVLGRSYAEIGRTGYRYQRSQAMGAVMMRPGPSVTYYKLMASRLGSTSPSEAFLDGLGEDAIPKEPMRTIARNALAAFRAEHPEAIAPLLAEGLNESRKSGEPQSAASFERALRLALGVELEALVEPEEAPSGMAAMFRPATTFRVAVKGQRFRIAAKVHVRRSAPVETVSLAPVADGAARFDFRPLGDGRFEIDWQGGASSTAHWKRGSPFAVSYEYDRKEWFGWSLPAPPLQVRAVLRYQGVEFDATATPLTRSVDSIGLELREPLAAGPALAVKFESSSTILPLSRESFDTEVTVHNVGQGRRGGTLRLQLPGGWAANPSSTPFKFTREGEQARFRFTIHPGMVRDQEYVLRAVAESDGELHQREFEKITYPDLESVYLDAPAQQKVRGVDVTVARGLKAGYIMGSGDEVPVAMRQLGVEVEMLNPDAVAASDLSRFNVIVTGIRAYAVRDDVKAHNARLLEYVRNGGTLIVQYNTPEFDNNYGPYPYTMTSRTEETSEETAPVTILDPGQRVFKWPNEITERDFDGWVEQRGSKFWMKWDERYTPLIETHDTGQAPQKGVWLQAQYGKGTYVYCALAWYRQLPFAVPGAVRIFANLLSLGVPAN